MNPGHGVSPRKVREMTYNSFKMASFPLREGEVIADSGALLQKADENRHSTHTVAIFKSFCICSRDFPFVSGISFQENNN